MFHKFTLLLFEPTLASLFIHKLISKLDPEKKKNHPQVILRIEINSSLPAYIASTLAKLRLLRQALIKQSFGSLISYDMDTSYLIAPLLIS